MVGHLVMENWLLSWAMSISVVYTELYRLLLGFTWAYDSLGYWASSGDNN